MSFARNIMTSIRKPVRLLNQHEAIKVDQILFDDYQFSVDQLMELAGLAVAQVVHHVKPPSSIQSGKILICAGPGNNGGDGLVAARHLNQFGYKPLVVYPTMDKIKDPLYGRLMNQLIKSDIPVVPEIPSSESFPLILDALFGFSFRPPVRPSFQPLMDRMIQLTSPNGPDTQGSYLVSIDIPSGWDVETGPSTETPHLNPDCLISLTAPKMCAQFLSKDTLHFCGGRFVPPKLRQDMNLGDQLYSESEQFYQII